MSPAEYTTATWPDEPGRHALAPKPAPPLADCDLCANPVPVATLAIATRDAAGDPDLYACRACYGADAEEVTS